MSETFPRRHKQRDMEVGGYQGSPRVDTKSPGKLMTDGLLCDETVLEPGDGDIHPYMCEMSWSQG